MAGVASDDGRFSFSSRILRPINRLRYTRQPSCIDRASIGMSPGRRRQLAAKGSRMQHQLQTWQEVESYLQTSRGIILPIGSTEQHGPTGLIGTDAICAEGIGRGGGGAAG